MVDFIKILNKPKLYQAADTENIKAVVGGINTEHFAPSANISFKMQSGKEQYFFNICDDIDQVKTVGKEEDCKDNKLKIKDGDVESTFELLDTSLKIERVFYTKPTKSPKYKIKKSDGIYFDLQPTLEDEYAANLGYWIESGKLPGDYPYTLAQFLERAHRPDNMIGAYVIRCNRSGHYRDIDGKTIVDYKSGRLGHLLAPYWTDANGKIIKGTQTFENNILTFSLPTQEWLDSATLPIKLDPNLGYSTKGGSTFLNSADSILSCHDTTTEASDTVALHYYCLGQTATDNMKMCLYDGSSNSPVNQLLTEVEFSVASDFDGEKTSPSYVTSLADETKYWVALTAGENGNISGYYDSADANRHNFVGSASYDLPATWPGGSSNNTTRWSMWAEYGATSPTILPIIMNQMNQFNGGIYEAN